MTICPLVRVSKQTMRPHYKHEALFDRFAPRDRAQLGKVQAPGTGRQREESFEGFDQSPHRLC